MIIIQCRKKRVGNFATDDKVYQYKLNKVIKISQEDKILIFKNLYLLKGYGARRLLGDFPTRVQKWKLQSFSLAKKIHIVTFKSAIFG